LTCQVLGAGSPNIQSTAIVAAQGYRLFILSGFAGESLPTVLSFIHNVAFDKMPDELKKFLAGLAGNAGTMPMRPAICIFNLLNIINRSNYIN